MKIGSYQQLFRIFRLYLTIMSSHKKQVYCGSVPQVLQLSLPVFHLEAGWWQHWWQNKKYHPLMGVAIKNIGLTRVCMNRWPNQCMNGSEKKSTNSSFFLVYSQGFYQLRNSSLKQQLSNFLTVIWLEICFTFQLNTLYIYSIHKRQHVLCVNCFSLWEI